jgi:hypothetical protein
MEKFHTMLIETRISDRSQPFIIVISFAAVGLLSGILTAGSLAYLSPLNPFVGGIFGVVMAISLSLRQRMWSVGRIIAFIGSCIMAYFAAIWLPSWVFAAVHQQPDLYGPGVFSLAGFFGGFVTMLAVLLLFFQENGWRVPAKALVLALPGALLGLISATASDAIQGMIARWRTPSGGWGLNPELFYSAYLIWQTGMGCMIAALLARNSTLSLSAQPVPMTRSQMNLSLGGKIFVVCVLTGTALVGFLEVHDRYIESHEQRPIKKSREQAPSAENLPLSAFFVGYPHNEVAN